MRSRSYGSDETIVKRGPQFVQFVNGYRYRRSAGSESSARHSGQVAMSGGIVERAIPSVRLSRISNRRAPEGGTFRAEKRVSRAAGGTSFFKRARNRAIEAGSPSARTTTAPGVFVTHPDRLQAAAIRWTKGRNPTPSTIPRTVISTASVSLPAAGIFRSSIPGNSVTE